MFFVGDLGFCLAYFWGSGTEEVEADPEGCDPLIPPEDKFVKGFQEGESLTNVVKQ